MKLETYILKKLKTYPKVEVNGFGTFFLKNSEAKILEKSTQILPPAKVIALELDYEMQSNNLAQFVVNESTLSLQEVKDFIDKHATYWKNQLAEAKELRLDGLGVLFADATEVVFRGERLEISSPDHFGLEAIDVNALKEIRKPRIDHSGLYPKKKSTSWTLLLLIPAAGLIALALFNKELIFGKRSIFESASPSIKPKARLDSSATSSSIKPKAVSTHSSDSINVTP